jgi:hypothetical protein
MPKDESRPTAEANELYWNSDASVGEIANQLGMSRRALYDVVEPKSAEVPCPTCGTTTVFANRSALAAGLARCPSCETETAIPAARSERVAMAEAPAEPPAGNGARRTASNVTLGGAALVGAVVGAIATLILTRRDD